MDLKNDALYYFFLTFIVFAIADTVYRVVFGK